MKMIFDSRGNGDGKICPSIVGGHQQSISDYTAIALEERRNMMNWDGTQIAPTLTKNNAGGRTANA